MCLCVCERVMRAVESSFNLKQNLDCCVKAPAAPLCVCVCICVWAGCHRGAADLLTFAPV